MNIVAFILFTGIAGIIVSSIAWLGNIIEGTREAAIRSGVIFSILVIYTGVGVSLAVK